MGFEVGEGTCVEYSVGVSGDEKPKGSGKQPVSKETDAFGNKESGVPAITGGDEGFVLWTIGRMFVTAGQGAVGGKAEAFPHISVSEFAVGVPFCTAWKV